MNKDAFRRYLEERDLSDEQVVASISIAEQFETFLQKNGRTATPEATAAEDVEAFSAWMIHREINSWANYVALVRYGRFIGSEGLLVGALELIDGAEALENLRAKLGEELGEAVGEAIFEGVNLPPLGTPNLNKPALTKKVIDRLEATADPETCVKILGSGLRTLEDDRYLDAKKKYEEAGGIDAYLKRKGDAFLAELKAYCDEGTLFFTQPIDDSVIAYVRDHPEVRSGVRRGNLLIEAKIPHQTIKYLAATDPREKAYHYCHCPWVKESLKDGDSTISSSFCNCSAAFHRKPYEVIFGQKLQAEVLESVLAGDPWCKFAIHLPNEAIN